MCGHHYLLKAWKTITLRIHERDTMLETDRLFLSVCSTSCLSSVRGEDKLRPRQPQIKGSACVGGANGHFFKWCGKCSKMFMPWEVPGTWDPCHSSKEQCFCLSQSPVSASLLDLSWIRAAGRISYTSSVLFSFLLFIFGPRWCHWIGTS